MTTLIIKSFESIESTPLLFIADGNLELNEVTINNPKPIKSVRNFIFTDVSNS